jgi:uncharacterized protein YoxC
MRDRLVITITDLHESRHYNVHQIIKKVLIYSILFVMGLLIIGALSIRYLMHEVKNIEGLRKQIQSDYDAMVVKNDKLLHDIQLKTDELVVITSKIEDLEEIIGMGNQEEKMSLKQRVNLASITGAQKQVVLALIPNGLPIVYKGITSRYGNRIHPVLKRKEMHTGIDLRAKMNTPIYSPADGVVDFARSSAKVGYGRLLTLSHGFGFKTLYGHLNKIAVKRGTFVKKGDLVAYTGNSGLSSGPHLHYEIRFINSHLDPKPFMDWDMKDFTKIFEKEKRVQWQSLLNTINRVIAIQAPLSSQLARKSMARLRSTADFTLTVNLKELFDPKISLPSVKAESLAVKSMPQS